MLVDYERVVLRLKQHIGTKSHHGQRELLALIAGLEGECALEEGLPEKALRLYGVELFETVVVGKGDQTRFDGNPWFSGFVDGEGSFLADTHPRGTIIPIFQVSLRWDDRAVLEAAQATFGGRIYRDERAEGCNGAPLCRYRVADKESLQRIVAYFDRFPLLAKKARDYALWRQMVEAYIEHGGRDERLPDLLAELRVGRQYRESEADALVRPSPSKGRVPSEDGRQSHPPGGDSHTSPKEDERWKQEHSSPPMSSLPRRSQSDRGDGKKRKQRSMTESPVPAAI